MRVLFADSLNDTAIERLRAGGDECAVRPGLTARDLPDHVAGFDVLVVRSTEVTADAIGAGTSLGLIVRAGAGTNTIDCERAAERGVFVCNVPGRNAVAVAELTIGLMLAIDRHIAPATADLHAGRWDKKTYSRARGLLGSTLGVIGMGAVGIEVARRALALGLRVITEDKPRHREIRNQMAAAGVETVPDRSSLLAASDIVSLHVPGDPSTVAMVDADFLNTMKPGAMLINTARGEIIDEPALVAALDSSDLRVGLDVFCDEPPAGTDRFDSALVRHHKVTGTHHIGASTHQAQMAVAEGTVELIEAYRDGTLLDCVNLERTPRRTASLIVRHYDRVGVLAAVLQELRRHHVNIANMSNRIFAGSVAAAATIEMAGVIDDDLLDAIRAIPDVINLSVFEV